MECQHQNVAFLSDENWLNDSNPHRHHTAPVRTELETTREKSACEKSVCAYLCFS